MGDKVNKQTMINLMEIQLKEMINRFKGMVAKFLITEALRYRFNQIEDNKFSRSQLE